MHDKNVEKPAESHSQQLDTSPTTLNISHQSYTPEMTEQTVYREYLERKNDREKKISKITQNPNPLKSNPSQTDPSIINSSSRPHIRSKLSRYRKTNILYKSSQIICVSALILITIITLGIMFFMPTEQLLSPHSVDVEGIFPIPGHLHGVVVPHNRELDAMEFLSPYFDEDGDVEGGPDPELEMVTQIKPLEEIEKEVAEIERQDVDQVGDLVQVEENVEEIVTTEQKLEIVKSEKTEFSENESFSETTDNSENSDNGAQEYHQIQNVQNKFALEPENPVNIEPPLIKHKNVVPVFENQTTSTSDHENFVAHFGEAPIIGKPRTKPGLLTSTTSAPETTAYFQDVQGPQYRCARDVRVTFLPNFMVLISQLCRQGCVFKLFFFFGKLLRESTFFIIYFRLFVTFAVYRFLW